MFQVVKWNFLNTSKIRKEALYVIIKINNLCFIKIMIRFNNSKTSKNKKLLIIISDLIRKIFGGDRVKRLSLVMIKISKEIYKKDKKK